MSRVVSFVAQLMSLDDTLKTFNSTQGPLHKWHDIPSIYYKSAGVKTSATIAHSWKEQEVKKKVHHRRYKISVEMCSM